MSFSCQFRLIHSLTFASLLFLIPPLNSRYFLSTGRFAFDEKSVQLLFDNLNLLVKRAPFTVQLVRRPRQCLPIFSGYDESCFDLFTVLSPLSPPRFVDSFRLSLGGCLVPIIPSVFLSLEALVLGAGFRSVSLLLRRLFPVGCRAVVVF